MADKLHLQENKKRSALCGNHVGCMFLFLLRSYNFLVSLSHCDLRLIGVIFLRPDVNCGTRSLMMLVTSFVTGMSWEFCRDGRYIEQLQNFARKPLFILCILPKFVMLCTKSACCQVFCAAWSDVSPLLTLVTLSAMAWFRALPSRIPWLVFFYSLMIPAILILLQLLLRGRSFVFKFLPVNVTSSKSFLSDL